MRHFLSIKDFTKEELLEIIELAVAIKAEGKAHTPYLKNQTLAMIFEKSSTRTRVSFETGIYQLGGMGLFLSSRDIQIGRGEPIKDTARVISRMCDMVMIRTFEHAKLEEFASFSRVPVINGLTDGYHPVQLMADFLTMREYNKGLDSTVAYIGDGNNVAHSWLMLAGKLGFNLNIATPKGYACDAAVVTKAQAFAKQSGAVINISYDPNEAMKDVDVVTTDTWVSMGDEAQKEQRVKEFAGFGVDEALMRLAKEDAIFLHCLPAYRGYEVSEETFEKHADEVFDEAENRLHAQKAIMVWLDRKREE